MASSSDRMNVIEHTERELCRARGQERAQNAAESHAALWLDMHRARPRSRPPGLHLQAVSAPSDWQMMADIREAIEKPFGVTDRKQIGTFVDQIKRCHEFLDGQWYLALHPDQGIIGEIGLVSFDTGFGKVGRLQDVDIIPAYQGRGFGHALLDAIILEADQQNLEALCLKADLSDWPKDWYVRRGFVPVGAL